MAPAVAAATPRLGTDAELVRMAARFCELEAIGREVLDRSGEACDRGDYELSAAIEHDDRHEPKRAAEWVEWETLLDDIAATPATTPEGFRAKARVVRDFSWPDPPDDGPASANMWSLVNDMMAVSA